MTIPFKHPISPALTSFNGGAVAFGPDGRVCGNHLPTWTYAMSQEQREELKRRFGIWADTAQDDAVLMMLHAFVTAQDDTFNSQSGFGDQVTISVQKGTDNGKE